MSHPAPPRLRFVVCGSDALAFRLVTELVAIHDAEVTVVSSPPEGDDPSPANVPGVTAVPAGRWDRDMCHRLDLAHVDALALVEQNDGGNVNAALVAREHAPHVRIVMRIFDETLAESMHERLEDCAVLSSTAVAAPAFLAAALGGDLPTPLRVADRLLYVTERSNTRPENIVCVLSAGIDTASPEILPDSSDPDDLVLTSVLTGGAEEMRLPVPVREPGPTERSGRARARAEHGVRIRRRARRRVFLAVTRLVGKRLWWVVAVLAVLLVAATTALVAIRSSGLWEAFYLAILNTVAGATPDLRATRAEQILQVVLTVVSVALIPAATAAVVEAVVSARLALASGGLTVPVRDHFVVVGLGDVGTRVLAALDDAGEAVVGIDTDPNARGVAVARQRRVPVVIGDAKLDATLRAAYVQHAHGLVVLTSNDLINLETALIGRKLGEPEHTVLRLFDAEFAERVQRAFGFAVSRSVSSLAAPSFAAAMLGKEVVATIAVHRRVLVVAEIAVGAGSPLEGQSIAAVEREGETQLVAIRTGRGHQTLWLPPAGRQLVRTDHIVAITTRAGLGTLLARSRAVAGGPPQTLPVHDLITPDLQKG